MSNDIRNWAKTIKIGDRKAKSIFLELADCADDNGYCFPKVADLAATLEMSVKTVERGLDYLVSKDRIERPDSDRNKGKFTNKATQILFGDDDISFIKNLREKRKKKQPTDKITDGKQPSDKLTYGKSIPSDKLTDGNEKPSDNLSKNGQKPQDKLTDGEENHASICPEPYDNLTVGQNDALNINKKDVFKTSIKTLSTLSKLNTANGAESETWDIYLEKVKMGIADELKISELPNPGKWTADIRWSFSQKYFWSDFVETFAILNGDENRKYPVTPKNVVESLPFLDRLRKQTAKTVIDQPVEEEEVFDEEVLVQDSEKLPEISQSERETWKNFLQNIAGKIEKPFFETWFSCLECCGIDGTEMKLFIRATNFNRQWLESNYLQLINGALHETGLENFQIEWTEK